MGVLWITCPQSRFGYQQCYPQDDVYPVDNLRVMHSLVHSLVDSDGTIHSLVDK